ncbi:MAG: phage terminase large subunit [Xanthobacteraceae bacterium]
MSLNDHGLLEAILRQDFAAFVRKTFDTLSPGQTFIPGWHIDALAYQFERLRRGEITRLIINMPPRSLKSITASVAFPAFVLGHDPTRRIICASYSGKLADKLSNDFRAILSTGWYQSLFPRTRIGPFKDSETEVEVTQRGFRLATSTGGTLTGRGGDLIIIDDPLKPIDALSEAKRTAANQWFLNTVMSRLDDKRTGGIAIIMQRVHIDDLTGFVLGQSDDWTVLSLPAVAESAATIPLAFGRVHHRQAGEVLSPEREPTEILDQLRQQLGSDLFSAQYQQAPVPPGGVMIKRHWVQRYSGVPAVAKDSFILQSWDTASKGGPDNDWSVCTTWLETMAQWYLLDVWRKRVDYPSLKAAVLEQAKKWNAHQVLIEEAGTAVGLLQELGFQVPGLVAIRPERDKETRMAIASAKFEAKQVYLPDRASWLVDLEAELFSFPGSRYDDQIDSISQALNNGQSDLWQWIKVGQSDIGFGPMPPQPMFWNVFRPVW